MTQRGTRRPSGALRRAFPLLAPLLAVALLGFGCQPKPYQVGQNDVNPVPRASLPSGGTLNWPITTFPANYNANNLDGSGSDLDPIVAPLLPSTFSFQASGQPVLNRDYFTSATSTITGTASAPVQVLTYEIDPRAVWSDGSPITEADFAAQWQALSGQNPAFQAASTEGYSRIAAVQAGSTNREVVVVLSRPFADWTGLFSPLYPASLNATPASFNAGWITGTVTSAGPFSYQGFDANAQTVTLVRNKSWWGTPAKLDSIVFHVLPDDPSAQLDALAQGTVDFVDIQPQQDQLKKGESIKNAAVRKSAGPTFRQITFNGTSPTMSDLRVRTAVALSIDRAKIASTMLGPLGVPTQPLDNHIFMVNQDGYKDNAGAFSSVDTAKAGALLDQAGWKLNKGTRSRNGQPLEIRIVIPSNTPEATTEAGLIRDQLKAVGITLTIQTVAQSDFQGAYVGQGDFDLALFSWQGTEFPVSTSQAIYQQPAKDASGNTQYFSNYARIGTPEIDRLFAQASSELDRSKVITLGNQIDALIWQEVHSITLYQRPQITVERSNLANFGAFGFATPNYEDIGFTKS